MHKNERRPVKRFLLLVLLLTGLVALGRSTHRSSLEPASPRRLPSPLYGVWSSDGIRWTAPSQLLAQPVENPRLTWIDGRPHVLLDAAPRGGIFRSELGLDGAGGFHLGPLVQMPIDDEADPHGEPCLFRLPSGRYRLYYTAWPRTGSTEIRSAASADGISWKREPGARLRGDVGHPDVIATRTGDFQLMYSQGDRTLMSATSRDGLQFDAETSLGLDGTACSTVTTPLPDDPSRGVYCMLYERQGICSALSSDGVEFIPDRQFRNPFHPALKIQRSPSLSILLDGTWLMICTGERS